MSEGRPGGARLGKKAVGSVLRNRIRKKKKRPWQRKGTSKETT